MSYSGKCPFHSSSKQISQMKRAAVDNDHFFPNKLNLAVLNQKNQNNPMAEKNFDYAKEFLSLNLDEVKHDVKTVLTVSQPWWPADYGNYAPFMVRMAWHQAGTYRVSDGRGGANAGNQRFAPLNSWTDNGNLDKARRLLFPIKQKYGRKLSWADLLMLTGNVAIEIMGLKPFGFGGGREDIYASEIDTYWGPETTMLTDERHEKVGEIKEDLGASEMGLIYVNPEGPGGNPDPLEAAKEIRATFGNMNMNDFETVALIAGGHTFGKSHGAAPAPDYVSEAPENAPIEQLGFGWKNSFGTGLGKDTITSGIEGAWTYEPTKWDNNYFENLFQYDWECIKGPGGKHQWQPKNVEPKVPDAHVKGKFHLPMMMTTDIALKEDPKFHPISKHFYENPNDLAEAFKKAWYKLLHRDMGPAPRLLGKEVAPPQVWQDPIPYLDHVVVTESDIATLKKEIVGDGKHNIVTKLIGKASTKSQHPTIQQLIKTAWASASTFRQTDFRGGANGARIRFAPQRTWPVNDPDDLIVVLSHLERIQKNFNEKKENLDQNKRVSMADLIVLGGCAALEVAAVQAGHKNVEFPFTPGRMDAVEELTDVDSFQYLEPKADAFRNYYDSSRVTQREEDMMLDRAHKLSLTAPEMTVLVGGLRSVSANIGGSSVGVLTNTPGALTNDFFLHLLSMDYEWTPVQESAGENSKTPTLFRGKIRETGKEKWMASRADLIFAANSELRAIAEFYACDDSAEVFLHDFIKAWTKVMELDLFALKQKNTAPEA